MKLYVVEKLIENHDGDLLKVVQTFRSKPNRFNYIIFCGAADG